MTDLFRISKVAEKLASLPEEQAEIMLDIIERLLHPAQVDLEVRKWKLTAELDEISASMPKEKAPEGSQQRKWDDALDAFAALTPEQKIAKLRRRAPAP